MSYFPHGAIAAAHAEQERKQQEEEEEKMTPYNNDELDSNWEFKIVRSDSNAFRKPEVLQNLIDEESISGWEMLEKLDDRRIRFKRPSSAKNNDFSLPPGIDPYRSRYGRTSTAVKMGIVLGLLLMGVALAVYFAMADGSVDVNWGSISVMIPTIGIMVALIGVVFAIKRRG